jgi:drug/metabolite transporter (DMT)-like permease
LRKHPEFAAYAALVSVCFFWSTTYLGIRIALETFAPLQLVCMRYVISGTALLVGAKIAGAKLPRGRDLFHTALNGAIILGIGNGCLAFSEQWIPSGLAALFIATSPFWMVGMEALVPGGAKLHAPTIGGMLIGLAGVAVLVAPHGTGGIHSAVIRGFLTLQAGCAGWAFGSILQRRHTSHAHPIVSGAVQQLATGVLFIVPALATTRSHPIRWSPGGLGALLYLVMFGSIVGYSSYIYALSKLPVPIVSIYNYINPMLAVFLGWLVFREPFGRRELVAMAVILTGVAVVKRYSRKETLAEAATESTTA